ncbi:sugar phosphate isomerase/epimerase [Sphingomonas piscis]|uniref:Sugar phosphate isomerase/epimerase n=1 Tax=Sphingomonas piscis TaxID=2714943 RepID=A0A6G7YNF7_9SPHN|nr:sugar phosphate isomerase/epimerase [Sphingomonas piscis]QIK78271.1 sugar phosphate isomerase/epimerase [Sphingomonas piscis]
MVDLSRRRLLAGAGLLSAGALLPGCMTAPAGGSGRIPPGIQLWTVKEEVAKDLDGTLRALRTIGFKRVEGAGWHGRTPAQFRKSLDDAGLTMTSAHYGLKDLIDDAEGKLAFARDVGVPYVVASSPAPRTALDLSKPWPVAVAEAMTPADWQSNAEAMNRIGARAREMGMRFGYHNHNAELVGELGRTPLDEIVRLTDPANVVLELDIGWVASAGWDPLTIIARHAPRIHLLHIKDIKTSERAPGKMVADPSSTVLGQGTIDWPAVFRAVRGSPIHSYFYEQEDPFTEPPLQAAAKSLAYLRSISI